MQNPRAEEPRAETEDSKTESQDQGREATAAVWSGGSEKQLIGDATGRPSKREEARARRRRCDYGSIRASGRDLELLEFVGEQYAVTVPQIARLINRRLDTARSLRDRWKRAGWVSSGQLSTQAPSFVWLTRWGAAGVQSPFRVWEPNHGLALHMQAITDVRILLDCELRLGEWECERSVAQRLTRTRGHADRGHLPDAVLHANDERIAIEVELTLKSRIRLKDIIDELSLGYDHVWYFVPARLTRPLTELAADAPYSNVSVRSYPPLAVEAAPPRPSAP